MVRRRCLSHEPCSLKKSLAPCGALLHSPADAAALNRSNDTSDGALEHARPSGTSHAARFDSSPGNSKIQRNSPPWLVLLLPTPTVSGFAGSRTVELHELRKLHFLYGLAERLTRRASCDSETW